METLLSIIEQFFDKLGMMKGDLAEIKRFSFGLIVSFGVLYIVKPPIMFTQEGNIKPWSLIVQGSEEEKNSTIVPIWLASLIGGTIPALFV